MSGNEWNTNWGRMPCSITDDVMSDPDYVQPTHDDGKEEDCFDAYKEQLERDSRDLHVDPPKSYEEATHGA